MPATRITWRDILEMPEDGKRYEAIGGEPIHIVREDWIRGAPDLVIEIVSPSTARRDRTVKPDFYRRLGVPEYWVVDAGAEQVEAWPLAAGATEPERHTG